MDLNHIELSTDLIADLYSSVMVDPVASTDAKTNEKPVELVTQKEKPGFRSLGDNQKNILILVNDPDSTHIADQQLNFLTGILSACKLSLADVSIVNRHQYPESNYKDLTTAFKSKIVLLFDIEPSTIGLPMIFPHYQIQAFARQSFLYAPSLSSLENDKLEKSKLWVSLKRLFNI